MGVRDEGISEGGSRILKYGTRRIPITPEEGDPDLIAAIDGHISRYVGPVETVWHEWESDLVHLDVHVVPPHQERRAYTLITSGMSQVPMKVEQDGEVNFYYAELMISLPPDWPMDEGHLREERYGWPMHSLYTLARLPHAYDTWFGPGHTIPNGEPPEPLADNSGFVGILLLEPITLHEDFWCLDYTPDKTINFLALYPLYAEEMDLKLRRGAETLLHRFERHGITDIVDIQRRNVSKFRWKLF
jgi:hypothetical protein